LRLSNARTTALTDVGLASEAELANMNPQLLTAAVREANLAMTYAAITLSATIADSAIAWRGMTNELWEAVHGAADYAGRLDAYMERIPQILEAPNNCIRAVRAEPGFDTPPEEVSG
jgi:hypothetical protein